MIFRHFDCPDMISLETAEEFDRGISEVPPMSASFEKKDSLVRVKGCNNIGGKSCRSEKN